jgi:RNA polymerase sigma-70 factor (ECF subfamily)
MTFRGQCSVRTYLMVIARNLVRDHTRLPRFKFWQRAEGASVPLCEIENRIADDTKSAERSMLEEEALRLVWRAAAGLPEKQYAVFLLRFVEDMEVLEIAQATGLKVATVRSRLRSAVVLVRRRLPRSWKRFVA